MAIRNFLGSRHRRSFGKTLTPVHASRAESAGEDTLENRRTVAARGFIFTGIAYLKFMPIKAQFPEEHSEEGEFERQEDAFRGLISKDGSTSYPAAAGRYHLYVSLACPWAS